MKALVLLCPLIFAAHWVRGQDEELLFGVCLTGHERTMYEPAVRTILCSFLTTIDVLFSHCVSRLLTILHKFRRRRSWQLTRNRLRVSNICELLQC